MNIQTIIGKFRNTFFSARFLKFAFVGLLNTGIDFSAFFALHLVVGLGLVASNCMSFSLAVLNSYLMNKYWTFKHSRTRKIEFREFSVFFAVSATSVFLNTSILVAGSPYLPLLILKIAGAFLAPLYNYLMYHFIVFKAHHAERK